MNKSRDLSIVEYFEASQREYIVAELRKKIYPKRSDKTYYHKVMEGKREKILDISDRNDLPCIFNDQDSKKQMYQEVYGAGGLPNFIYRNDKDREEYERYDLEYYYHFEKDVKVKGEDGSIILGKINDVNFDERIVFVRLRKSEKTLPFEMKHVSRVI